MTAGVVRIIDLAFSKATPHREQTYSSIRQSTQDEDSIEVMYNRTAPRPNIDRIRVAWKRIHGDVFRQPRYFMVLTLLVGTGIQLSMMTVISLLFSAFADR
jgi:hypothetical protein